MTIREGGPDRARVRVLPPLVPLVTIVLGNLLQRAWPIGAGLEPSPLLRLGIGWAVVGVSVLMMGLWPAILLVRSGQSPNPWKPTPSIVERGPYRFTRNPMYLALVLLCVGVAVLCWDLWTFLLTPACALVLRRLAIEPEERYLEEKFGDAYREYRNRVRRWI